MPNFLPIFCIFVDNDLQIRRDLPLFIDFINFFTGGSNYSASNPANTTCVVRLHNCEKMFFQERVLQCTKQIRFFRNPKTKTTSEFLRRRFSTAKRGSLKHKMHAQDRTRRSHQNQPFDTKTVSNALARVKVIPDVSRQYSAHLAPCTPRFARNRKYTAAKPPPSPDSTQPETRRHIPAPLRG